MTCDIYVSDDAMNRSPQLVPQKINYGVGEEPPPFAENDCDKGTHDRSRKPHQPETRYGDGVLIGFMGPDHLDVRKHAEENPLDWSPKQGRLQDLDRFPKDILPAKFESKSVTRPPTITSSPVKESKLPKEIKEDTPKSPLRTLPPPVSSQDLKPCFPPQRPRLQSLTAPPTGPPLHLAPHRRTSTAEGLSPDSNQADLKSRISLPSLQSLASPANSCVGASPDNTQSLPSIHSALGLSQSEFSSTRINGFPPPSYSYSPSTTSRNDSPHERQLPSISQQIPPSPFSHFSPISTKDISNNASPASQPCFWRTPTSAVSIEPQLPPPPPPGPPPPPAVTRSHHYELSPMTATSPATSYPTPIEPVPPTGEERTSFSSHPSPDDGTAITSIGVYKCTHAGCTAAPFQTQYLLK
ncbi:hypothetical protein N7466_003653 [Penicillium verhagenii]|uniref:uncharacterized protein n=1 Tax=Penicillium verhagenii TaxID=1562060 RepID=UPI0025457FF0|nr:uncharacterized protein N7466_003653 [Penicillium verhagenii]KAJ5934106.1 hypothetical protein N7466_003653 [Penicillium verhagenii]